MVKNPDTIKPDHEQREMSNQLLPHQRALDALKRLRAVGERLPPIDAAAVVREGREPIDHRARR